MNIIFTQLKVQREVQKMKFELIGWLRRDCNVTTCIQISRSALTSDTIRNIKIWQKMTSTVFTARCYAERGIAMASRLSVCLSVRNVEVL